MAGALDFRGDQLDRVLVPPKQPDAEVQIITVEIYADGLVVRQLIPTFDRETVEWKKVAVRDDAGNEYLMRGGGGNGLHVFRGQCIFVPAPPPEARRLFITTRAGTVELGL